MVGILKTPCLAGLSFDERPTVCLGGALESANYEHFNKHLQQQQSVKVFRRQAKW